MNEFLTMLGINNSNIDKSDNEELQMIKENKKENIRCRRWRSICDIRFY